MTRTGVAASTGEAAADVDRNPGEAADVGLSAGRPDFFTSTMSTRKRFWQRRRVAALSDALFDARIAGRAARLRREMARHPARRVLLASVEVPARAAALQEVVASFRRSRHSVSVCTIGVEDRGKFENINVALAPQDLGSFDWLIVTDDDVRLPPGFLDTFLFVAETAGLKIAQPAHRCRSYTSFMFNYRKWNCLARETRYVEDGPVTAFHRDVFPLVLPFPALRWSWATDLLYCEIARRRRIPIGIVDCVPIEHLRPVAHDYRSDLAAAEARAFLDARGIVPVREEMFVDVRVVRRL